MISDFVLSPETHHVTKKTSQCHQNTGGVVTFCVTRALDFSSLTNEKTKKYHNNYQYNDTINIKTHKSNTLIVTKIKKKEHQTTAKAVTTK